MPTEKSGGAFAFCVDCHREVASHGWDEPCKSRGLRTVLWAAGGEIPPADPAIATTSPGLPVRPLFHLWPLSSTAPSVASSQLSQSAGPSVRRMDARDVCAEGCLNSPTHCPVGRNRVRAVNVTRPGCTLTAAAARIESDLPSRTYPHARDFRYI